MIKKSFANGCFNFRLILSGFFPKRKLVFPLLGLRGGSPTSPVAGNEAGLLNAPPDADMADRNVPPRRNRRISATYPILEGTEILPDDSTLGP